MRRSEAGLRATRGAAEGWPIPWTAEDLRSTWLAPERLLLYVQLAEPDDQWSASLKMTAAGGTEEGLRVGAGVTATSSGSTLTSRI